MRVIAGSRRSIPLKAPKGIDTRPTQDRTKETLFNVLNNDLYDCTFLDIFSGSGGIAIEALSRGASKAYLIEKDRNAIKCIKENLKFTHFEENAVLLETDVYAALSKLKKEGVFDIIFMDPPYNSGFEKPVIDAIVKNNLANENTIIVIEAATDTSFNFLSEYNFEIYKTKKYKTNQHVFIRKI